MREVEDQIKSVQLHVSLFMKVLVHSVLTWIFKPVCLKSAGTLRRSSPLILGPALSSLIFTASATSSALASKLTRNHTTETQ